MAGEQFCPARSHRVTNTNPAYHSSSTMAQIRSAKSKRAASAAARRRFVVALIAVVLAVCGFSYLQVMSNFDGSTSDEIRAAEQQAAQTGKIRKEAAIPATPHPIATTPAPVEPPPTPSPTAEATTAPKQVVCGAHFANTCEECPQGNGRDWCNGECGWCPQMGTCVPKAKLCTECGKKATDASDCEAINQECMWCDEQSKCMFANEFCTNSSVVCGAHSAPTCRQCPQGNGKEWCNGECGWCDPIGVCMKKSNVCTSTCGRGENTTCETQDNVCSWCDKKSQCLANDKYCPRPLLWAPAEKESWFVKPEKDYNTTLSVILPCGHEYLFFERTIWSIFNTTPPEVLHEIIIVDDNSDPPLESIAEQSYENVKYVRSNVTLGLIKAKHVGSEIATGDVIVFFDCHVKPAEGWWEPMVREISENPRRVVVPTITNLDVSEWKEWGRPAGESRGSNSKCYLTFGADFMWTTDDTPWVPIMSGGLLAIKRSWFFEVGGHDQSMQGWGGENLDLSLRIWLCGGDIVYAEKSYVGHMFRVASNKDTKAAYKIPVNSAPRNRAKAMKAHTGLYYENKTRVFRDFQHMEGIETTSIEQAVEKLQCKDFFWYLKFFAHIYRDAGLIPKEVFQITPDGGKSCLAVQDDAPWGYPVTNEKIATERCDVQDGFSATAGRQFFQLAGRNSEGKCCSGLRLWNMKVCVIAGMRAGICNLDGVGQKAALTPEGFLNVGGKCWNQIDEKLTETECSEASTKWTKWRPFVPEEYNLLSPELKEIW